MADPTILASKAELRAVMRARREAIPAPARWRGAEAIAAADLTPCLSGSARVASTYWSMGAELCPGLLEGRLQRAGLTIALPVMVGKGLPLVFRAYREGDELIERMWGIREPAPAAPEVVPDILFVPLLAFDALGYRLGYGGGFYDRTLAGLRAQRPIHAVGLAYEEQEVDSVPHCDYDQRLDYVLTPAGLTSMLGR